MGLVDLWQKSNTVQLQLNHLKLQPSPLSQGDEQIAHNSTSLMSMV